MKEDYIVLGLSSDCTDEELETAYLKLKAQYSKDRFLEGEAGNLAAKNLTKLENAYNQIKAERSMNKDYSNGGQGVSSVEQLIKEGKLDKAQEMLDSITDRNAEWHYLQSVLFYKKNWINESKKQLEIALKLDPGNKKYIADYKKLMDNMAFQEQQFRSGNGYNNANSGNYQSGPQMGGDACTSFAECCACNLCLNCLCSGCCR